MRYVVFKLTLASIDNDNAEIAYQPKRQLGFQRKTGGFSTMEKKEQVVAAILALSNELGKSHKGSATAKYVAGTLTNLQHCNGLGFPETMQDFFQHAPVVKLSEGITLNDAENKLWNQAFSYTKYCDNLWTASV